ncbi:MAG: epoxyqueuosine reductase [Ruminococcaceae bacterium]|nr:epoxyqueuosine reductase [Oscillospiraceae bacterium]
MKELDELFREEKIEYYAVLDYKAVTETNPDILKRNGDITPRSIIVFLLPYYCGETVNLSRYSASLDYHILIRRMTDRVIGLLSELFPGSRSFGFGDHSPIDERGAALAAGLGIKGDNGLLINEKYGSYIFIADVITDISPERLGAITPRPVLSCSGCGACKTACPTGILRGEGNDCLSAVTQRRGELSDGEISLMKEYNTVWGCDVCQSSCPHNCAPVKTPIEFFYLDRIPLLTEDILNHMDKSQFRARAFAWRGKSTVRRNLRALGYGSDEKTK